MSDLKLSPQTLALYLGCEVFVPETNKKGTFEGINWVKEEDGSTLTVIIDVHYSHAKDDWDVLNENDGITRVKPVLKKLSSMTEEEARELFDSFARYGEETVISRKHGNTIEVICYDPKDYEEDGVPDNPVPDQLFEDAEMNEALMRVELKPFNVYKGWEHDYNEVYDNMTNYHIFRWLLSKHFDLFGLIDAGLAIEKQ